MPDKAKQNSYNLQHNKSDLINGAAFCVLYSLVNKGISSRFDGLVFVPLQGSAIPSETVRKCFFPSIVGKNEQNAAGKEHTTYIIIYMMPYILKNALIFGDGNGTYIEHNHPLYIPCGWVYKSAPGWERYVLAQEFPLNSGEGMQMLSIIFDCY